MTVYAPRGVPSDRAIDAALGAQGARPATPADLQSANFVTTGLVWDQFSDADPGNDLVVQNYNPANDPVDGETVLLNTHATWNNVPTSSFVFSYGGTTTRCPSLVDECSGPQTFDGYNDVAYMNLSGPCNAFFGCTLGVTWFSTSIDEADMALNTKASWVHDCSSPGNDIDAETVTLHENGHVLGLGHTDVSGAVMEAFYGGANCSLHQDDEDGVTFLYPDDGTPDPTSTPTNTPVPTATPTDGPEPTATNTQEPTATATPDDEGPPSCPPGRQRRGLC
ncbi:MAG: matrixin family metalloprotease [Dehalococcoidia bacterium]